VTLILTLVLMKIHVSSVISFQCYVNYIQHMLICFIVVFSSKSLLA